MNKDVIEALTKAGAALLLALLLAAFMYLNHRERTTSDSRLFDLMERQTEALEAIRTIYSGDGGP